MKQFLLFLLALVPLMASADVTKDGVFYRCYEGEGAYVASADKSLSGDIVIPEYVKDEDGTDYKVIVIDENAFQDRAITLIVLPSTLESIYEDAFQGCSSLKDVTCMALTPPRLSSDAFESGHYSSVKIHVPTEALNSYKDDDSWKKFSTIDDKLGDDSGGIAIDAIHFPDETFRKYVSENFDIDKNGRLTNEEIKAVGMIRVPKKEIKSLKGIEYFTSLTWLGCWGNELTELDLSKNTALIQIGCHHNKLTKLDVSNSPNLEQLDCCENELPSIDVSNNPKLIRFNIHTNKLTAIDVSHQTVMKRFYCGHNLLTKLDVSNNLELDTVFCNDNQLTAMDISKNTKLKGIDIGINPLSTLDISKNTKLTRLCCCKNQLTSLDISNNLELDTLWCYDNQLTSLDVSKHTKLKSLNCSTNLFSSIDVSKNVKLEQLYIGENQVTSLDVTNNTLLQVLGCYGNKLTSLDVSKNTALVQLNCQRNQLTSLTMPKDGVLKLVYCHRNQIRGQAMDDMIASLPNQENGAIALFNTDYIAEEGNVCTTDQVAALKAKGWEAYHSYNDEWVLYPGSDPSAIDGISLSPEEDQAPAYNLNGQRTNKAYKGIVVKNGKKYIKK